MNLLMFYLNIFSNHNINTNQTILYCYSQLIFYFIQMFYILCTLIQIMFIINIRKQICNYDTYLIVYHTIIFYFIYLVIPYITFNIKHSVN